MDGKVKVRLSIDDQSFEFEVEDKWLAGRPKYFWEGYLATAYKEILKSRGVDISKFAMVDW